MNTSVLFLVFNRPDTTRKVFEKIREARPPRLYVAADGPREDQPGEAAKCEEVRKIATNVDWDCEVNTLFRDTNLGCKHAVIGGIDWFFEKEEMGIILEDDCLPTQSFFRFCKVLLLRYKEDERIMHINGNNFGAKKKDFICTDFSYHFGQIPQVWGWATWRGAWKNYNINLNSLNLIDNWNYLECLFSNKSHIAKQLDRWRQAKLNKIDTWDYQWQFSVISNHGLTIIPKRNLVSNIGFGNDATHTQTKISRKANLDVKEINFPLKHPEFILPDRKIDYWYHENMLGPSNILRKVKLKIGNVVLKFMNQHV